MPPERAQHYRPSASPLFVDAADAVGQLNPVTSVKRTRFSGDSEKSSNSAPRSFPLASRFW